MATRNFGVPDGVDLNQFRDTQTQTQAESPKAGSNVILKKLRYTEEWLDEKFGIETIGVERIEDEEKESPSEWNMFFMWWSLTCQVGTLPIGTLGPQKLGLSFSQCVTATVVGSVLGSVCTAFCATLGPKIWGLLNLSRKEIVPQNLGLRALATARYSFGYHGTKFISVLNIIVGAGFATVNVVVVGELLSAVSDYKMSLSLGCILIGLLSYFVSIFGFKIIHTYEKYSWIASVIAFCVLIGQIGGRVDPSAPPKRNGIVNTGAFLSYLSINFASCSSWGTVASDYYCKYRAETSKWKIYVLTISGLSISNILTTLVGICLANIATNNYLNTHTGVTTHTFPGLAKVYDEHGLGGILSASYHPTSLSNFFLIILSFSVVGNNIIINYSCGLAIQLLGEGFRVVPRFIWSFLMAVAITVCAVIGRSSLSEIVSNLTSLLGYWIIAFTIILAIENGVFRRHNQYDLNAWDSAADLPWGIAALVTVFISYFAGGVTGMAQSLYTGPIAKVFGHEGGDIGIILSGMIALIVYPPARLYERMIFGK